MHLERRSNARANGGDHTAEQETTADRKLSHGHELGIDRSFVKHRLFANQASGSRAFCAGQRRMLDDGVAQPSNELRVSRVFDHRPAFRGKLAAVFY